LITSVARVLIYSLMAFEWIVLAVLCFVAYLEMEKPHHKKLLFWFLVTAFFKIVGYSFSAFTAIPSPWSATLLLGVRIAFALCLIPFALAIYQVYSHIQWSRHQEEHEKHLAQ
jgi:hypothetical protein